MNGIEDGMNELDVYGWCDVHVYTRSMSGVNKCIEET